MERSKKVLFVSHDLLNQNVLPKGKAKYAGGVKELLDFFIESGIGIIQIGCPQVEFNGGLDRKPKSKDAYDTKKFRKHCRDMTKTILNQVEMYKKKDYDVLGFLGIEGSATCAVHRVANGDRNVPGKGILVEELEKEMHKRNFQIPIIGINMNNMFTSMEKLKKLLLYSR